MRKHKRHGSYKFTEKTHSKRGIVATILALVLLVLYLVILELAFRANGGLSAYYGSIGVLAMLASVVVVVVAAGSLREEDSFACSQDWDCFCQWLILYAGQEPMSWDL